MIHKKTCQWELFYLELCAGLLQRGMMDKDGTSVSWYDWIDDDFEQYSLLKNHDHDNDLFKKVVNEDPGKHGGEEQGRIVMVNIEHPAHRPEWYVMKSPSKEEPGGSSKSFLALLLLLRRLLPASLLLETGPRVDRQEDEEENNVTPPDNECGYTFLLHWLIG